VKHMFKVDFVVLNKVNGPCVCELRVWKCTAENGGCACAMTVERFDV
jgi:hypothetical protein